MFDLNLKQKTWTVDNAKLRFLLHRESFSQDVTFNRKKPFHSHSYYEILFSGSDDCQMLFHDKAIPFYKGSIIVLHPRYMHRAVTKRQECLFSIGFTFYKDNKASTDCDLFAAMERHFSSKAYIMFPPLGSFASSFSELERTSAEHRAFSDEAMFSIFLKILFEMLATLESGALDDQLITRSYDEEQILPSIRATEDTLQTIDHILNREFTTPITAADVSKQVYLSERQINRYMVNQYSQTFQQRKTYLRISTACKLLLSTDRPISDISSEVGYTSINTFYSAFKQQTGVTPNEFRINNSNGIAEEFYV